MNISGRISHPPSGPDTLAVSVGLGQIVAHPATGIWRIELAPGLQFTAELCMQVSATQPAAICSVECLSPTVFEVKRTNCGGAPEDGDVWISGSGVSSTSLLYRALRAIGALPPLLRRADILRLRGNAP